MEVQEEEEEDMLSDPPFIQHYRPLFCNALEPEQCDLDEAAEEVELPVVDLRSLKNNSTDPEEERRACAEAICQASREWGFFQVVSHGVGAQLLEEMRREQSRLFGMDFGKKLESGMMNNSYRWGTPSATSLQQLSWSEAFHVPLAKIFEDGSCNLADHSASLREVMQKVAGAMADLARTLAGVLAENLGQSSKTITGMCSEETCFLRLNRYPPCPFATKTKNVLGLTPHTDSDFLTILHQDHVGGLQLMKDSKWISVKPNPHALIVNIGDLFQAWSNDCYKSVEHKVMANSKVERFSIAFFLCPSYNCRIGSCREPSPYKDFTFGEYRQQVQQDVKETGRKIGLSRFLK